MKLNDAHELVQLRRPTLDPTARMLARCATIGQWGVREKSWNLRARPART